MSSIFGKVNIPVGSVGGARVERFTVTNTHSDPHSYANIPTPLGEYIRLLTDQEWVSTAPSDIIPQEIAYHHAHGHFLTVGLGLGAILPAILAKPEVESVTVLERDADVIALIGPHYTHPKLTIIQGDGTFWQPQKGQVFNVIWLDFLQPVGPETLWLLDAAVAHYSQWLDKDDPEAWCEHWLRLEAREMGVVL